MNGKTFLPMTKTCSCGNGEDCCKIKNMTPNPFFVDEDGEVIDPNSLNKAWKEAIDGKKFDKNQRFTI